MKLGTKIRDIRKNKKKMTLIEFRQRLCSIFDEDAISYKSLIRIEKGQRDGRLKSIHQIAYGLGMDVKDLLAGTERETADKRSMFADILRKSSRSGKFIYNEKAYIEILSSRKSSFMGVELVLEPGGVTKQEEGHEDAEILLIGTKGHVTVHVQNEEHIINSWDSIYFRSNLPHYFENKADKTAKGILVQYPKSF